MGRHDLLREAQQYAVNRQHAKALELLQRYLARCLAVSGAEDAAEKAAINGEPYGPGAAHNANSASAAKTQNHSSSRRSNSPLSRHNNNNTSAISIGETPAAATTPAASRVMSPPPDMRSCSDIAGAGKAYRNMGCVLLDMNQPKAAIDAFEKGIKIARQLKDRKAEAKCLASMGAAYERGGQFDQCISMCSEAEVMNREVGNKKGEAVAIANAAVALATMGQYNHAIRLHERALLMAQACGDVEGVDCVQENLENTRDKKEKYEAALKSSTHF